MAQDGLKVSTDVLNQEGKNFQNVGSSFGDALNRLQQGLTALEGSGTPPWGDDDLGEKFGVVYEGLRDGMYESMAHLVTKLSDVGQALQTMASNHDSNENFNNALMEQEQSHADVNGQMIQKFQGPAV